MLNNWLAHLCEFLPGVQRAAVVRSTGKGTMAQWPDISPLSEEYLTITAKVKRSTKTENIHKDNGCVLLACPMYRKQILYAVLCIELEAATPQVESVKALLLWAISWLGLEQQLQSREDPFDRILKVLELSSRQTNAVDSSSMLATTLADVYQLPRIMIALDKDDRERIVACSHTWHFDGRSDLIQQLEEWLNARGTDEAQAMITGLQAFLKRQVPAMAIQSLDITHREQSIGHLLLFHAPGKAPGAGELAQISIILRQLAPLYFEWVQRHHSLRWRTKQWLTGWFRGRRLFYWAGLATLSTLLLLVRLPLKVSAEAQLEGQVQIAVVAPEDGFLKSAFVKAGQRIQKDQPLALLDDESVRLEIQRWESEQQEYRRQFNRELNALNPAQMRIAEAKTQQAEAQLNLFRQRLKRLRINAPIDGIVIKGDLSRAIGSPVQKGQVLYEMAPADQFKLVIWVTEHDVGLVQPEQTGTMVLAAYPQHPLSFTVTALSSLYEERKSAIVYRVEADLTSISGLELRPGLSGVAKIHTQKQPLIELFTRDFVLWLRLKLWAM